MSNFLLLRRLPARLTLDQTAWYLGFGSHEISVLIAAKLLKPLGRPASNGQKYFASCELERLRNDPDWLSRASERVTVYKRRRNEQQKLRREALPV